MRRVTVLLSRPAARVLAPGVASACCAALLAGMAVAGPWPLFAVVLLIQVVTGLAWLAATEVPGSLGAAVVITAAAAGMDVLAVRRGHTGVEATAAVIALAFIAAVAYQLIRRARSRVTESLAVTMAGVVVAVLLSHLLVLQATRNGESLTAVALLSIAAAQLVGRAVDAVGVRARLVPGAGRGWLALLAGSAAGTLTGALLGRSTDPLSTGSGAALGLAVALAAAAADLAVDVTAGDEIDERRRAALRPLSTCLPVMAAAPVAYAATRLLVG